MAFFHFSNIRVGGVACAVPSNEVKTESYKSLFGNEEVDKFMEMTGVPGEISIRIVDRNCPSRFAASYSLSGA